jgi:hypothetical protein
MFPPVCTKHDFIRRFRRGEFGNRGPVWDSLEEFRAARYRGKVHLRNRIAGGSTHYNLSPEKCSALWPRLGRGYFAAAMAPHEANLLQGEARHGIGGLELYYSTVQNLPMRDALAARAETVAGIIAVNLLKSVFCPNSLDWFYVLLDRYPEHVIEFSCFSRYWGTVPRENVVIWEVRQY